MMLRLGIAAIVAAVSGCPEDGARSVESVLDQVERAGDTTPSMTADVVHVRVDPILGRREIRSGRLVFRRNEEGRAAAVLFDTLVIGQRRESHLKHFVVAGRWLAEIDHERKQFIKHELVPPGEETDLFGIDGPLPLPIGQGKEAILRKYEVIFVDLPKDGVLSKLEQESVVGLRLTPRAPDDADHIDLFFDGDSWLPLGVHVLEDDGTTRTSKLSNLDLGVLSASDAAAVSIKTPDPKEWSIDIRPWSGE